MTDQWRQANGVKQAGGVRIVSVKPDSFAEEIRLEPGDILLAINRTPVNSVEEVGRVQAGLKPGDAVQLRVLRRNGGMATGLQCSSPACCRTARNNPRESEHFRTPRRRSSSAPAAFFFTAAKLRHMWDQAKGLAPLGAPQRNESMRRILGWACILALGALCWSAQSAAPARKKGKASTKKAASAPKKAPAAAASSTGGAAKKSSSTKRGKKGAPKVTWRNRQTAPAQERYKEIQDALAAKGYLKPEDANGFGVRARRMRSRSFKRNKTSKPRAKSTRSR